MGSLSIINVDMWDKRVMISLTKYLNAVNPLLYFTCNGLYYKGIIDK